MDNATNPATTHNLFPFKRMLGSFYLSVIASLVSGRPDL